jgi:hypothetical protein
VSHPLTRAIKTAALIYDWPLATLSELDGVIHRVGGDAVQARVGKR